MTDPITPPPELVEEWVRMLEYLPDKQVFSLVAQWGADQELEACLAEVSFFSSRALAGKIRDIRRPKPSLKEQALMALEDGDIGPGASLTPAEVCIIRRALEALDD